MPVALKVSIKKTGVPLFDRKVIKTNWRKINRTPMTKAGMLVRKIARQSIRRGKLGGKPSAAGKPPKSRRPGKSAPFKMIFSVPKNMGTSALVGMVGFGGPDPIPELQEKGGSAVRSVFVNPKQRQKGRGAKKRGGGKRVLKTVKYEKRPFMLPALMTARQKLPKLWANSISGKTG